MLRREKDLTTVTWLQEERGAGRFDADCAAQKTSPGDEDALYAGWAAYEGDAPVTVPDAPGGSSAVPAKARRPPEPNAERKTASCPRETGHSAVCFRPQEPVVQMRRPVEGHRPVQPSCRRSRRGDPLHIRYDRETRLCRFHCDRTLYDRSPVMDVCRDR